MKHNFSQYTVKNFDKEFVKCSKLRKKFEENKNRNFEQKINILCQNFKIPNKNSKFWSFFQILEFFKISDFFRNFDSFCEILCQYRVTFKLKKNNECEDFDFFRNFCTLFL